MLGYRLPPFASIDELLREFAIHMLDTMYEGKDIRPRLAAKNRLFRSRLEKLGYGEVKLQGNGYEAFSQDGTTRAFFSEAEG